MLNKKVIEIAKPGNTPLVNVDGLFGVRNLYMKDETKNPNHTFKDRLAYEMVRPILDEINKCIKPKKHTFSSISYGNTAYSMGFYCDQINKICGEEILKALVFFPPKLIGKTYGPNTEGKMVSCKNAMEKLSKTCELIELDLSKKVYTEEDLKKIAKDKGEIIGGYTDITEGLDRPAYRKIAEEAFENQLKEVPDYVIVPFGAGILCNEVIDYIKDKNLKTKVIPVSSGDPKTIAVMLYGIIWVDTESLLKNGKGFTKHRAIDKTGRKREKYLVYHVSDDEILDTMKILNKNNITAEASGSVGFAILHRLNEIDPKFDKNKHSVLVINTGNGLLNY
ncbi:MAG: PLP-dependent lyase/thiolase [Candidatus Pacearchaeota archaeon]|jgi:threonine dehydratase